MSGDLKLKSGTKVQNIKGTSACEATAGTWKRFYERRHPWPSSCRIKSCGNSADGGGHVRIDGRPGVYIIPMCSHHNNPHKDEWQSVNEGTIAARVDEEDTSGPGFCR